MLYVGLLVSISPITDRLSLVFCPAQSLPLQLVFSSPLTQVALEGILYRWSVYKGCVVVQGWLACTVCVCVCVCVCTCSYRLWMHVIARVYRLCACVVCVLYIFCRFWFRCTCCVFDMYCLLLSILHDCVSRLNTFQWSAATVLSSPSPAPTLLSPICPSLLSTVCPTPIPTRRSVHLQAAPVSV